jgi:hypothetical protein
MRFRTGRARTSASSVPPATLSRSDAGAASRSRRGVSEGRPNWKGRLSEATSAGKDDHPLQTGQLGELTLPGLSPYRLQFRYFARRSLSSALARNRMLFTAGTLVPITFAISSYGISS